MTIDTRGIGMAIRTAQEVQPKLGELKKATDNFEAIFLKKMFVTMRGSVKHVQFGSNMGSEMYQDMFDQAIAEDAAKTGKFGLGEVLFKSFEPKIVAQVREQLEAELRAERRNKISTDPQGTEQKTNS